MRKMMMKKEKEALGRIPINFICRFVIELKTWCGFNVKLQILKIAESHSCHIHNVAPVNGHAFCMSFASCCGITHYALMYAKSLTLNRNHQQQWVCKVMISIEPTYIHIEGTLYVLYSSRGLNEHVNILLTTFTTCREWWEMEWMRWSVKSSTLDAFIDFFFVFVPSTY